MAYSEELAAAIKDTAARIGASPHDLATVISYETGGTFDPGKRGPTTKYGQHRGLIQWGEPQAAQYGVRFDAPVSDQLERVGAYLQNAGYRPGMGLMDMYSAVNAGRVGKYGASDAAAGGAPGTVADKVNSQMEGHKRKAAALLGGGYEVPSFGSMAASGGAYSAQAPGQTQTAFSPMPDSGQPAQSPMATLIQQLLAQQEKPDAQVEPVQPLQFAAPNSPSLGDYLTALQGA